jgi:hypothetical protein
MLILKLLLPSFAIKAAIKQLRRETIDARIGTEAGPALEHNFSSSGLPAKGGYRAPPYENHLHR